MGPLSSAAHPPTVASSAAHVLNGALEWGKPELPEVVLGSPQDVWGEVTKPGGTWAARHGLT